MPLHLGFAEVSIDASLLASSELSQKRPLVQGRSENKSTMTDSDIIEVPAASQPDVLSKKRRRSRRKERGQTNNNNEERERSSRIGETYQAAVYSHLEEEEQTPTVSDTDQIWDPQRAAELPPLELGKHIFCFKTSFNECSGLSKSVNRFIPPQRAISTNRKN